MSFGLHSLTTHATMGNLSNDFLLVREVICVMSPASTNATCYRMKAFNDMHNILIINPINSKKKS